MFSSKYKVCLLCVTTAFISIQYSSLKYSSSNFKSRFRNVLVFFDYIPVFGSSKADHDQCLADLKSTLQCHNYIINEEKSRYSVENIEYLGRQLSSEGIKLPFNATQAIQQCPAPSSKAELCSFLGMVGFFVASSTSSLHLLILYTGCYKKTSRFLQRGGTRSF